MKTKLFTLMAVLMVVGVMLSPLGGYKPALAAPPTDAEIQAAIDAGLAWLVADQQADGSWGYWEQVAQTCFALVKLEDRAYELNYASPFDPAYPYAANVLAGWQYVFSMSPSPVGLSIQTHGANLDNPDTNSNGYGLTFHTNWSHPSYTTGICLMALAASGMPDRPNDGGHDFNGVGGPDTFGEITQDAVDWMAFAQGDIAWCEGGWGYGANDNSCDWADNSNGGYSVLGLVYAENFGATVPAWVATELNVWIGFIQCSDGGPDDGGSGYNWTCNWTNELKTGNLIFQLTYLGDDMGDLRFQRAVDYIERHWFDANFDPGWGYSLSPSAHQAMYALMKGLEYSGLDLIDLDGDGTPEHDWYVEFAEVLMGQQQADGHWDGCDWGSPTLCTVWALLTLEKIAPPEPVIDVFVDIKPLSCPNPFNVRDLGVVPVAILGTADFDVTQIDPASVFLWWNDKDTNRVYPVKWSYKDVATPYTGDLLDRMSCNKIGADGYLDLVLHFPASAIKTMIQPVNIGDVLILPLGGNLKPDFDGTPIAGMDVIWIVKK